MHQGRIVRMGTPAEVAAWQPARISFELPEDSREPVPDIAGTRASVTGRTVLLQTADLQPTLTALLGWANSRDLVLAPWTPARPRWRRPSTRWLPSLPSSRRRQRKGRGGMSAGTVTVSSSRQSSHRVAALARAEGILLWRNRLALLNAVILPAALVGSLKSFGGLGASGAHDFGAMLLTGLTAFALLIAVYYNLVTAMVARREELVLKRLRTGEATDGEILAGTAAPAITIAWAQIAVAAVAAVAVLGLNPPANAALVPVALILGTAVFVLLAAVTAAVTRTVQLAQVTTMPALWLPLVFSGLLFPLAMLPEPLRWVAEALPLTPVAELMRLALTGTTAAGGHRLGLAASFGAAVIPVLVLTAWIAAAGWAARRWFRWEPRR